MNFLIIGAAIGAAMFVVTVLLILARYKTSPSNKILVKSGRVGKDAQGNPRTSVCYHGGGTFVWPVIQQYGWLDLEPLNVDIKLDGSLSKRNIRVNVPSSFTFAIGTTRELMNSAAERLLGKDHAAIKTLAEDIILGQLRGTIATMEIEEINSDREKFERLVQENIDGELRKVGLYLINTNIRDITDQSGYLEALGQEAAAVAVNDALVKVANSDRDGAKGKAAAEAEQRQAVAEANARAVTGENTAAVTEANSKAEREVAEAEANRKSDAAKAVKKAEAEKEGYAAEQTAEEARAERDKAAQFADEVVPAQIAAEKMVVDAQAEKEAAALKAEAIKLVQLAPMLAKAEGFKKIVDAAGGDANAAAHLMIVEQLPTIVEAQAKAISNIDFGEITVVGGAGDAADFLQNTVRSLPGMHAFANGAGVKLPGILGELIGDASEQLDGVADETFTEDDVLSDEANVEDVASEAAASEEVSETS